MAKEDRINRRESETGNTTFNEPFDESKREYGGNQWKHWYKSCSIYQLKIQVVWEVLDCYFCVFGIVRAAIYYYLVS